MKALVVQWYGDEGNAIIFHNEELIAEINSGDRAEVTKRLRLLGLRPTRWRSTDWGFEANLTVTK